jgi:cytoskeleton protein RodZ
MSDDPATEASAAADAGTGRSIGAQLAAARKARNLDIELVATELKLDVSTIRALENDDRSALPAPIFVKGYLRSYARLVGVPEEELVRAYSAQVGELPPLVISRLARPAPRLRLPSTRLVRNVVLVLLLGIMVWLAWPMATRLLHSRTTTQDSSQNGQLELPPPVR